MKATCGKGGIFSIGEAFLPLILCLRLHFLQLLTGMMKFELLKYYLDSSNFMPVGSGLCHNARKPQGVCIFLEATF